mmetsp:Transcript_33463/g.99567  ORF Transcript_33463/g.99567 Transcript_33463/m.99567 type:complete len:209 (+) Transcript_33463:123-749(+)
MPQSNRVPALQRPASATARRRGQPRAARFWYDALMPPLATGAAIRLILLAAAGCEPGGWLPCVQRSSSSSSTSPWSLRYEFASDGLRPTVEVSSWRACLPSFWCRWPNMSSSVESSPMQSTKSSGRAPPPWQRSTKRSAITPLLTSFRQASTYPLPVRTTTGKAERTCCSANCTSLACITPNSGSESAKFHAIDEPFERTYAPCVTVQ